MMQQVKHFAANWLGLMSGIISVILAVMASFRMTPWDILIWWLAAYIALLVSAWTVWRRQHQLVAALQNEVADLKRATSQPLVPDRIKTTVGETKRWIAAGHALCQDLVNARPHSTDDPVINPELAMRVHKWVQQTHDFVRRNAPLFGQRFETDDGIPTRAALNDPEATKLRDLAANRVARLEELLDHLVPS